MFKGMRASGDQGGQKWFSLLSSLGPGLERQGTEATSVAWDRWGTVEGTQAWGRNVDSWSAEHGSTLWGPVTDVRTCVRCSTLLS